MSEHRTHRKVGVYPRYDRSAHRGDAPSALFDWDAALYRFALLMRNSGYTLSAKQQQRIDDGVSKG